MRSICDIRWCTKSKPMLFLFVAVITTFSMFYISKYQTRYLIKAKAAGHTVPKTMHLVVVSCGKPNTVGVKEFENPLQLSLTMLKSAALFAKSKLHFHIFTEDEIKMRFIMEIESWPQIIRKRINYTMYSADYSHLLPQELIEEWKAWYKPCGSFRLFLPMLLGDVTDSAIYCDSDVIFLKPIDELWNYFNLMNERHVFGASPTGGNLLTANRDIIQFIPFSSDTWFQINSGVMLLNFTRILNIDWNLFHDANTSEVATAKYGTDLLLPYYKKYKDMIEHDQKMLNIMFHFNSDRILKLPCSWNFHNNICDEQKRFCFEAKENGVGGVHGVAGAFIFDHNPAFKELYKIFKRYRMGEDLEEKVYKPYLDFASSRTMKSCSKKFTSITNTLHRNIKTVNFI